MNGGGRMRKILGSGISFLALVAVACSGSTEAPTKKGKVREVSPAESRADIEVLVRGNNTFAVDFYKTVIHDKGNVLFSPYSLSSALAMVYAGAEKNTKEEIKKTLHFSLDPDKSALAFSSLTKDLTTNNDESLNHPELKIANSLWFQEGIRIKPDFMNLILHDYEGAVLQIDFHKGADQARKINKWIESHTKNKIKNLFQPNDFKKDTRLVIVSVIHMKAKWKKVFSEENTKDSLFYLSDGKTVPIRFMEATGSYPLLIRKGFSMLELPYKGGVDSPELALYIILPDKINGLSDIENRMDSGMLRELFDGLQEQRVNLFIPKYKLEETLNVNDLLKHMGMGEAFTDKADFSGITGNRDLKIDKVIHKTFLDIDEKGTEAAAATGISMNTTAIYSPEKPYIFRADRPFIFMIADKKTKSILWMGRLENPETPDSRSD